MQTTMMPMPLSTQMILRHGTRLHAASRVSTFDGEAFATRTFAETAERAQTLAAALAALSVCSTAPIAGTAR